ncbi:unnamed protein product [Clavelina lepadiformis]|uniref:Major facilitator superfamily (MFS) profile domain-containing protein n=1 Tax=Clavelina lepadiformis TaxID=159417 RepID=A0ABP0GF19_CLALP
MTGLGFALASLPALTMIGRYFKKRRSLANGLSRSGGGATFFLAPILQLLVDSYGWQGCLFVIAGLELHLIACALLFRPLRLKEELQFNSSKTLEMHRQSVNPHPNDQPNPEPGSQNGFKPTNIVARRAISGKERVKALQKEVEKRVQEYGVTESLIVDHFPRIEPVYEPKKKRTLDFSLLKNPLWAVITANLVLTQFGYSITLVHLVARAKLMDIGQYKAAMLLSLIGLSEVIAQLSSGALADKGYIRRIHLHKIYITVMAIATACGLFANSFETMMIYCVAFGCGSGSWQGNILPVTVDTLGIRQLRSAYGFCLFFSGLCGQLIGPPVAGALYDATKSYTSSFVLALVCFIVSSLLLWLEIPANAYMRKKEEDNDNTKTKKTNGVVQEILMQEMHEMA